MSSILFGFVLQNIVSLLASCILQNKTYFQVLFNRHRFNGITFYLSLTARCKKSCVVIRYFCRFSVQSLVLCPKLVFSQCSGFTVPRTDTCVLCLVLKMNSLGKLKFALSFNYKHWYSAPGFLYMSIISKSAL